MHMTSALARTGAVALPLYQVTFAVNLRCCNAPERINEVGLRPTRELEKRGLRKLFLPYPDRMFP
jgi:hypothetical protein